MIEIILVFVCLKPKWELFFFSSSNIPTLKIYRAQITDMVKLHQMTLPLIFVPTVTLITIFAVHVCLFVFLWLWFHVYVVIFFLFNETQQVLLWTQLTKQKKGTVRNTGMLHETAGRTFIIVVKKNYKIKIS